MNDNELADIFKQIATITIITLLLLPAYRCYHSPFFPTSSSPPNFFSPWISAGLAFFVYQRFIKNKLISGLGTSLALFLLLFIPQLFIIIFFKYSGLFILTWTFILASVAAYPIIYRYYILTPHINTIINNLPSDNKLQIEYLKTHIEEYRYYLSKTISIWLALGTVFIACMTILWQHPPVILPDLYIKHLADTNKPFYGIINSVQLLKKQYISFWGSYMLLYFIVITAIIFIYTTTPTLSYINSLRDKMRSLKGLHPPNNKSYSNQQAINRMVVPVQQHIGSPAKPELKVDQVIAEGQESFMSVSDKTDINT